MAAAKKTAKTSKNKGASAPRKKASARTSRTPRKPPAPKNRTGAAKRKPPAVHKSSQRPLSPGVIGSRAPVQAAWLPVDPAWEPATAPPEVSQLVGATWAPAARPNESGQGAAARAFDPATGQWLPAPSIEPQAIDPAAYRRGSTRSILLNVLLGMTLGLLALNFLAGIVQGLALVFAPDSAFANKIQEGSVIDGPWQLAGLSLLMFLFVGVIPFFWVVGTRVVPWLGTKHYLQLWFRAKDWVRGIVLVPVMLVAVIALSAAYLCATEGCSSLTDNGTKEDTGVDVILDNLTWPVAVIIALGAGIGEEILFRGVLQKRLGVWGQAVAFGLAHAGNGYPPQVLFAFGLGVAFGFLFKRGWSLVSLIIAHTLYDLVILGLALLYPELA